MNNPCQVIGVKCKFGTQVNPKHRRCEGSLSECKRKQHSCFRLHVTEFANLNKGLRNFGG